MSKSGNLFMNNLENSYYTIKELAACLQEFVDYIHDNQKEIEWCDNQSLIPIMDNAIAVLDKVQP